MYEYQYLTCFCEKKMVRTIIRLNVIIFIKIVLKFINSIEIVLLQSSENIIFQNAGNNKIECNNIYKIVSK